jgi:hypothetical protein
MEKLFMLDQFCQDKTKVVHCKREPFDVYIGRPSKWGNPFRVGKDGNLKEVIDKYRDWIILQDHLIKDLHELREKILGCWCKPKACHGDVLIQLINYYDTGNSKYN